MVDRSFPGRNSSRIRPPHPEPSEASWPSLRRRDADPVYIDWRKGIAFVAGGNVERGSARLSRSTCRDITWPKINIRCTIQAVLRVSAVEKRRCLRRCRRLDRTPARHKQDVASEKRQDVASKGERILGVYRYLSLHRQFL
jgi:hypothetical protein